MGLFLRGKDFLSLDELRDEEIGELLAFARELKSRSECGEPLEFLAGVNLFIYDPDRLSPAWDPFGLAMAQLGGQARLVDPGRINLAWDETFLDLFRQLDRTGHGLAMACAAAGDGHGFITDTAALMDRPVLNMISDVAAPFHTLATLMTLTERLGQDLGSTSLALCWAPPGLAAKPPSLPRSLAAALIRWGVNIRLACPLEFHPGGDFTAQMDALVPGAIEIADDPEEAVQGADLVFAFNWGSETPEDAAERTESSAEHHALWRLTAARLSRAAPGALVGGGLPQSRGREIQASLLESPRSIHLDESVNLLHVAKAVLALTLDLTREP